jgi:hypothetical protein
MTTTKSKGPSAPLKPESAVTVACPHPGPSPAAASESEHEGQAVVAVTVPVQDSFSVLNNASGYVVGQQYTECLGVFTVWKPSPGHFSWLCLPVYVLRVVTAPFNLLLTMVFGLVRGENIGKILLGSPIIMMAQIICCCCCYIGIAPFVVTDSVLHGSFDSEGQLGFHVEFQVDPTTLQGTKLLWGLGQYTFTVTRVTQTFE